MYPYFLFQDRAASIATYALCGFCSVSTVSVAVGVWNAIVPERAALMASQLFRVTINANISCFLTACIAGEYKVLQIINIVKKEKGKKAY